MLQRRQSGSEDARVLLGVERRLEAWTRVSSLRRSEPDDVVEGFDAAPPEVGVVCEVPTLVEQPATTQQLAKLLILRERVARSTLRLARVEVVCKRACLGKIGASGAFDVGVGVEVRSRITALPRAISDEMVERISPTAPDILIVGKVPSGVEEAACAHAFGERGRISGGSVRLCSGDACVLPKPQKILEGRQTCVVDAHVLLDVMSRVKIRSRVPALPRPVSQEMV